MKVYTKTIETLVCHENLVEILLMDVVDNRNLSKISYLKINIHYYTFKQIKSDR
jgi:hypothetical protein